ncbi:MAG: DUF3662 domain-containing protein [Chloroflexi bacterium]|nr:DUF3662 domain-containing protein [Chloroflexota bacterium]
MTEAPHPLERILQKTARKVSGGGLHPLEILSRVQEAVAAACHDGVAPNDIVVELHPVDHERYRPALPRLRDEIVKVLDQHAREAGLRLLAERRLRVESSDEVAEGSLRVQARFVGEQPVALAPSGTPSGATRRLVRHRGSILVLGDGTRVALTHTPFTIGRGPGNDLVIPSLAVSRQHAEIAQTADGYVIRDLGSRNGILVDGVPREWVLLAPGVVARLGDTEIRLERA